MSNPDLQAELERIRAEISDSFDEELELQYEDDQLEMLAGGEERPGRKTLDRRIYFRELFRLQHELVRLQDWIAHNKLKVAVIFEGRDSAGKGGAIKRITQRLNPRVCRVVALPAPSDREKTQWYFQRYVPHLPAAGEMVLFDRSWYNRAGVERVMGFCTPAELEEFFRTVPEFEKMLVRSGIVLIKFWFSITNEEQEFRFKMRIEDPLKQWKLSPMDMESRRHWEDYTKAKKTCCSAHIFLNRRGGWSMPTTRSGRVSMSSLICSMPFPMARCPSRRSFCPSASGTPTMPAARCRQKCM